MKAFQRYIRLAGIGIGVGALALFPMHLQADETAKKVDILFTSDIHSHLNEFSVSTEEGTKNIGGLAKIQTLMDAQREENQDTLVVDAGDFSMGTLLQTIYSTEAPELRMLGYMGVEATTIGNHEFDYRSEGLADMLIRAKDSGEELPQMLVCNVDWEAMEDDMTEGQQLLSEAFHTYGVSPYTMIQKGDINIAVIGVFGKDALACSPTCELEFKDPVLGVQQAVEEIKAQEDADLILCLSHCGTNENPKKSEDEILAKEVPELDLIISGHAHRELEEPIVYGDTYIVASGKYGEKLGSVSLEQKSDGRWEVSEYDLLAVDEAVAADETTQEKVDEYTKIVDETYLKDFGYTSNQLLVYNPYEFSSIDAIYKEHTDHNLGNLMSDAFFEAVAKTDTGDDTAPAVAIVPSGCMRESYPVGELTVSDVFNSYSLGIGMDKTAGYPLISVYLTGKELKTIAEIDASVSDLMAAARLYCSGMNFSYNPNRLLLNKVTDVYLTDETGQRQEIEDEKLYRVIADLYSGQMLGAVENTSYGILAVTPKFADGTPIENMEDAVIYDKNNGNKEIKAWTAIASYMESFPENEDGIPEIPAEYETAAGRKIVEDKANPVAIFSGLNIYGVVILLVGVILISIAAAVIVLIVRFVGTIKSRSKHLRF